MMMKGPVREIIPLTRQQVSIRVPEGKKVTKAHLLVAGKNAPFRQRGNFIDLEVPTIELHEVVALDLQG